MARTRKTARLPTPAEREKREEARMAKLKKKIVKARAERDARFGVKEPRRGRGAERDGERERSRSPSREHDGKDDKEQVVLGSKDSPVELDGSGKEEEEDPPVQLPASDYIGTCGLIKTEALHVPCSVPVSATDYDEVPRVGGVDLSEPENTWLHTDEEDKVAFYCKLAKDPALAHVESSRLVMTEGQLPLAVLRAASQALDPKHAIFMEFYFGEDKKAEKFKILQSDTACDSLDGPTIEYKQLYAANVAGLQESTVAILARGFLSMLPLPPHVMTDAMKRALFACLALAKPRTHGCSTECYLLAAAPATAGSWTVAEFCLPAYLSRELLSRETQAHGLDEEEDEEEE